MQKSQQQQPQAAARFSASKQPAPTTPKKAKDPQQKQHLIAAQASTKDHNARNSSNATLDPKQQQPCDAAKSTKKQVPNTSNHSVKAEQQQPPAAANSSTREQGTSNSSNAKLSKEQQQPLPAASVVQPTTTRTTKDADNPTTHDPQQQQPPAAASAAPITETKATKDTEIAALPSVDRDQQPPIAAKPTDERIELRTKERMALVHQQMEKYPKVKDQPHHQVSTSKPTPPANLKPNYERRSICEMARAVAEDSDISEIDCFLQLDRTLDVLARSYEMIDLGIAEHDVIEAVACCSAITWEKHEHVYLKSGIVQQEFLKTLTEPLARSLRLISSYSSATKITSNGEMKELEKKQKSSTPFLSEWYTHRIASARLGSRLMTNAEQRRAVKTHQYDPTYCAPTSLRVIALARNLNMPPGLQNHPLLDKILTEEELHVASRFGLPNLFSDVMAYVTMLSCRPNDLDPLADLQYNPDFFKWWISKP